MVICLSCNKDYNEALMYNATMCERCYEWVQESNDKYEGDEE